MCISAIELLGDAMSCKGSVFSAIDCNDSSWCDSRDEVIEYKSANDGEHEEDLSGRYGDLLDTQSLSSSVHNLLYDSSRRQGQHSMAASRSSSDDDIFRCRRSPLESSCESLPFNKLNRCTAWIQDDYSFESEQFKDESKMESVRIVHWEDRVIDPDFLIAKNGCGIFRPNDGTAKTGNGFCGSFKLHRCSAWSLDDSSSLIIGDNVSSVRRRSYVGGNQANIVHWDELVQGPIQ